MGSIHPSVKIGQGAIIADEVELGADCVVGPYSIITGDTNIGPGNVFGPHTVIGADPQDRKYKGERARLTIGRGNIFREFSSVHRGHLTEEGTIIGDQNWFLAGSHAGHDCRIGNGNFLANGVLLAGHVEVADGTNISGHVAVHQFCRIGSLAMVSGLSGVRGDIYPFALVQGDPAVQVGINLVGLRRSGHKTEEIEEIRDAFRRIRAGEGAAAGTRGRFLEQLLNFRAGSKRQMLKFAGRRRG